LNISVVGYAVLAMLGVALWAYSRFRPHEVSPLGQLLERLMSRRRTRLAIIAVWWWLGWHFFTNVRLTDLGF
jgi:hypothetical protein